MSVRRLQGRHWLLVAGAALAAALSGVVAPLAVLAGGGAMSLVLLGYQVGLDALLRRSRRRLAITLLFVKLAALSGLGWLTLVVGWRIPDPLGLAAGVACFALAAVWEATRAIE